MALFDVSIDLTAAMIPTGSDPAAAVVAVRRTVEEIEGSGWVSVEWCGDPPAGLSWLRLYRPGRAEVMGGDKWDALERLVGDTVMAAAAEAGHL